MVYGYKAVMRDPEFYVIQVIPDEITMEAIADKFKGSVRGTRLPPIDRVIQFRDIDGDEVEAKVSDWIVVNKIGGLQIWEDDSFRKTFSIDALEPRLRGVDAPPGL